jgi:hypothetical protein
MAQRKKAQKDLESAQSGQDSKDSGIIWDQFGSFEKNIGI